MEWSKRQEKEERELGNICDGDIDVTTIWQKNNVDVVSLAYHSEGVSFFNKFIYVDDEQGLYFYLPFL